MVFSRRVWITAALAVALGLGTWLLLRGLGPASLSPDFPARPDLQSANTALVKLVDDADERARSHPDSALDVGRLGMVYHANQFYGEAERAYAIASRLDLRDYQWPYYQALLAEERGQERARSSFLHKTLELRPGYVPALQKQGDAYLKQDDFEKARACYEAAQKAAASLDSPQARFGLARIAQRRGDWTRVIDNLEPLVESYPGIRPAHQLLAEAYEAQANAKKAARERAVLLDADLTPVPPGHDPLYQELVQLSYSSTRLLKEAGLLIRFGRSREAIPIGRRAVEVAPQDPDAHHFLARTLLQSQGGDAEAVQESLIHLNEGLRLRPDDLVPLFYFATFFFNQEKTDVAVEELRSMLARNPGSAEAHYYLGVIAGRRGHLDEAVGHYQDALRIDPRYAEPTDRLGSIMMRQGQIDQAVKQFRKAVELKPAFVRARCNLGVALEQQGKLGEAIQQYQGALRIKPNEGSAQMYLAIALLKAGRLDQAIGHFRDAVRITHQDPEAHYGLGFALAIQGDLKEARREFQEALRLRPDYEEAREQLGKLDRGER